MLYKAPKYSDVTNLGLEELRNWSISWNKVASEGRDEDRIAERDYPDWIAIWLLHYRLLAGYLQSGIHILNFPEIL